MSVIKMSKIIKSLRLPVTLITVLFAMFGAYSSYITILQRNENKKSIEIIFTLKDKLGIEDLSKKASGLKLSYDGSPIESFSFYRVTIRNNGGKEIKSDDFEEPILISSTNGTIVLIPFLRKQPLNLNVINKDNKLKLGKCLLNPDDIYQFEIGVINANREENITNFKITGRIAGIKEIKKVFLKDTNKSKKILPKYLYYFAILLNILGVYILISTSTLQRKSKLLLTKMSNESFDMKIKGKELLNQLSSAATELEQKYYTSKSWIAKTNKDVDQGVNFREMPLANNTFTRLEIIITSESPYWRAGIKLETKNATETMPKLLTDKSLLLHIGKTESNYGAMYCINGNYDKKTEKTFIPNGEGNIFRIKIEMNEDNILAFFVNEQELFNNITIPKEIIGKLFFVAWGDKNDFEVIFNPICLR